MKAKTINLLIAGDDNRRFFPALILGLLVSVAGCSGSTSSGTSGGPGYMTVPLEGTWHGSWSRNTTLTDIIVDTDDATTHLDPLDGVARLEVSSASGSSQSISGTLLMTGFKCFTSGAVGGSWAGSNIGFTVTDVITPADTDTSVASIEATIAGTSYVQKTTSVTLTAPDIVGGVQATATATVSATGTIVGFVVTTSGSGYSIAPAVTITDTGDGEGAVGTASLGSKSTPPALSLSGHQTSAGEIKLAYTVSKGDCEAKRGSITLSKSS